MTHIRRIPRLSVAPAILALALCSTIPLPAQEAASESRAAAETDQKMSWPRDRDRVICRVGGADYTLLDMMNHFVDHHAPNAIKLLEATRGRELRSPRGANWVRQFADVVTLERYAADNGITREQAQESIVTARKDAFARWLDGYSEVQKRRGRTIPADQDLIDSLYDEFKRTDGLAAEVEGWLNFLVAEVDKDDPIVREYYNDHTPWFGGALTIAHILVETRDERTLELKVGEAQDRAQAKIETIERALEAGDVEFDNLARRYSDDENTARMAGRIQSVARHDPRLPASVCRTAWNLRPGEVSGPVESQFGIHFIKRVSYRHLYYVFWTEDIKQEVASTMRQALQEDILFGSRTRYETTLRY
ncbi:MAG: peptidylprolyl isomerase [Planctomycetota bacterium]